jgi:hypothetical protein
MVFFLCEFTERRFKFSGTKNQTAAQNAANDLNPSHLGLMRPCVLEEGKKLQ